MWALNGRCALSVRRSSTERVAHMSDAVQRDPDDERANLAERTFVRTEYSLIWIVLGVVAIVAVGAALFVVADLILAMIFDL